MFYNNNQKAMLQQMQMQMMQKALLTGAVAGAVNAPVAPQAAQTMPVARTIGQQQVIQTIRQSASTQKRQFINIRVQNTTGATQPVVLFDALGTYQFQNGVVIDPGVIITGQKKNYQVLQTRFLGGNSLYFDQLNIFCSEEAQFEESINIFEDNIATGNTQLILTIDPSISLNSMQQNANRTEIIQDFFMKGETAMVYNQLPNSEVIFRFFIGEQVSFN